MKTHSALRIGLVLAGVGCLLALTALAFADIPAATPKSSNSLQGVEHHWVSNAMGVAPYTELTAQEKAALAAAKKAMAEPDFGLIRNADHGYEVPQRQLDLIRTLKGVAPMVVGHELVVWNGDRAARVQVDDDGLIRVVETGPLNKLLPTATTSLDDHEDADAAQVALAASQLGAALNPNGAPAVGALVSGHLLGAANHDGIHTLMKVDVNDHVSFIEW